ncbi:YabP/YqfC family sporulation protein [[Clostridium] symbiosum]|uniref:YabP/YqfC family sporulation protein n=1 Tax=Clostridium symbiosum TaxID=1512 RepID=UPI001D072783|nr:YabP/YqfC family sporulation protein [[Clostridium] symbiosum]MCB6607332.1 YabP/YqfC family sporulation protein [[Clostridium] symbiosum]MCB6930112.1 YabP/YqfC family sporulation protein [[Clostridium] symbiosum]
MFNRQKKAVVSALNLPEDVFFGEMLLSFTGSHSAVVENYRSIVLFTDTMLKLQGKTTKLTVEGKNLSIEYYDKEQLKLTGHIKSVDFESL